MNRNNVGEVCYETKKYLSVSRERVYFDIVHFTFVVSIKEIE